jgi:hypothetical protein
MYHHLNKIGWLKQTWGSEPSQYPEEEKTTVIPLVAASERGNSLNHEDMSSWGRGIRHCGVTKVEVSGTVWKGRP